MDDKKFLTYNQQMRHLRDDKKILCRGSSDKTILCRTGYFNLINGYKDPFVAGIDAHGNHTYYNGTSIQDINAVKSFDDELRSHLLKFITSVEEEVRSFAAYKFDDVNGQDRRGSKSLHWLDMGAYDPKVAPEGKIRLISSIYNNLKASEQDYVKHYWGEHGYMPTWIVCKVMSFSNFIDFVNYSHPDVKKSLCALYGMTKEEGRANFKLLIGGLHWARKVRNACAHNERIYALKQEEKRIACKVLSCLPSSYSSERDQKIFDLIVYMRYCLPDLEYGEFIDKIIELLRSLQRRISPMPYEKVRASIGIKRESDLDLLKSFSKDINYNKF